MSTSAGKVILKSRDDQIFEMDEAAAMLSQTIKHSMEDAAPGDVIPIPAVSGEILAKVVAYCRKHAEIASKEELQAFDAEFIKVDDNTLFEIVLAANYLNVKKLLDLTIQATADLMKDKSVEWVRNTFNIENDFTTEEEAAVRRENEWAFQTN